MNIKKANIKIVIFYLLWGAILWYLYGKFIEIDPFGKNSTFMKSGCKSQENKTSNILRYEDL